MQFLMGPKILDHSNISGSNIVFIEDHLGSDHDDDAIEHVNRLIAESVNTVLIEYLTHDQIDERAIRLPAQAWYVSYGLRSKISAHPWTNKTCAFGFMINKKRWHREWLVQELENRKLHTPCYSLAWGDFPNYPRRGFQSSGMDLLHNGINNGIWKNIDIYRAWLQRNVFEPTYITLITEPAWRQQACFVTEKTVFAFESGNIPLWIGGWGTADQMKKLGFDVFDDIVDHGYQYAADPLDRMRLSLDLNGHLLESVDLLRDFFQANQDRFQHNRQLTRGSWLERHLNREVARLNLDAALVNEIIFQAIIDHDYENCSPVRLTRSQR
jgi:hypothetical protein